MKRLSLLLSAWFLAAFAAFGQAPGIFNYQGVARNSVGNVLKDQTISVRLTIRDLTPAGTAVFSETRTVVTNPYGLFNIQVGSPGASSGTGTIAGVNWAAGAKYLQVEISPTGGGSFINLGTVQLASVPFALNAAGAAPIGPAGGDLSGTYPNPTAARIQGRAVSTNAPNNNDVLVWNGTSWTPTPVGASGAVTGSGTLNFLPKFTPSGTIVGNSLLFDNGSSIGVGTTTPSHRFTVSHAGSTGIGVSSTSGFSVVDIDAASGDAALRFGNAGVNQWNMRNQPGTDNLQIFELGGGGERMHIQNGTGNVSIGGEANPSYRLDVLHGGSTGARIRSSGSFSVVDIDASSGDAALRFANAGVNQWNIRNQPGTDNLQIFELGGGGERMHIQNATGNVSIGGEANPSYRLDILHGGSTGIRNRSTGSFSVFDIDAASGDAAIRFANAGVNQWNIRNQPGTDNLQIFELGGGGERMHIQNATGNVSIGGEANPSYRLDILHGGSTGIRNRSSGSFSVIDIDAASGDAALRFANAGVNQWNVRNQPGTDNLQIFELGGGGERMHIQNATGNISIGGEANPSYRLDVLHGGATGARIRSSSTFSVVDIDAASGDAALRFVKAGVNQWNTRNNPGTDDYQIFELGGGGERMRIENTTGRVVVSGDFTVLGAKAFTMDHPLDPANKLLMHAAAESNEVINFYSGNITTDASGKAVVKLPDYFEALNKDFRYQLTVIGSFAQAIISKEVRNNTFEIATSQPNVKVSWEVKGVRNDARMRKHPFVAEQEKTAAQKGKYWDAEAHGQPASKGVSYDATMQSSLNDTKPVATKAAPATSGGSLDQAPVSAPAKQQAADNSGSVAETPAPAKVAPKPADNTGSVAEPAPTEKAKPAPAVNDANSSVGETKTEAKTKKEDKKPAGSEQ